MDSSLVATGIDASKCRKPAGSYCRLHNPAPVENTVSSIQQRIRDLFTPKQEEIKTLSHFDKEQILNHEWELEALMKNLNMKVDSKTGKKTVSVFRSGIPEPPVERGVEKDYYLAADNRKPENRQGRYDAVFASPTLTGVTSWS